MKVSEWQCVSYGTGSNMAAGVKVDGVKVGVFNLFLPRDPYRGKPATQRPPSYVHKIGPIDLSYHQLNDNGKEK